MDNPSPVNVFTVDLEDWFQGLTSTNPMVERWPDFESRVVPATQRLLGILQSHGVQATFFALGYVADRYQDLIARIQDDGHEIGIHGYSHRFVYRLTQSQFSEELARSIEAVMRVTGEMPAGHRAPYFSVNASTPWAFRAIASMGLQYDSSVFPTRNMLYGYPSAPRFPYRVDGLDLIELPASTVKVAGVTLPAAGGFYMRALPYVWTQWAIQQLNRAGKPAIVYIHPWELDLGQRYGQVTARERITHYHGRRGLERKVHRLLNDFRFTTMRNLVDDLRTRTVSVNQGGVMAVESQLASG